MKTYFTACTTLEELKAEYRRLALLHHPDVGGDEEAMKAINAEYDRLFPVLKLAYNRTAAEPTHETAQGTRSEFYTQHGWNGSKYQCGRATKDISADIRAYVKATYPDCKFSVTTHLASMCASISVSLMSGPYEAIRDGKEHHSVNEYYVERDTVLTEWARAVMLDVNDQIKSYRHSDCDSMIDYFDVNFYYSLSVGQWDKPYRVLTKQPKITTQKPETETAAPLRVVINEDFNGIEVYFSARPDAATRDHLKATGWRWHGVKKCWYNRNTEDNLLQLRTIAG